MAVINFIYRTFLSVALFLGNFYISKIDFLSIALIKYYHRSINKLTKFIDNGNRLQALANFAATANKRIQR